LNSISMEFRDWLTGDQRSGITKMALFNDYFLSEP
jgi:hypothetical protein